MAGQVTGVVLTIDFKNEAVLGRPLDGIFVKSSLDGNEKYV